MVYITIIYVDGKGLLWRELILQDSAAEQIEFHGDHSGPGSRSTKCNQFLFYRPTTGNIGQYAVTIVRRYNAGAASRKGSASSATTSRPQFGFVGTHMRYVYVLSVVLREKHRQQ